MKTKKRQCRRLAPEFCQRSQRSKNRLKYHVSTRKHLSRGWKWKQGSIRTQNKYSRWRKGAGNFINPTTKKECYTPLTTTEVSKQCQTVIEEIDLFQHIEVIKKLTQGGMNHVYVIRGTKICTLENSRDLHKYPLILRISQTCLHEENMNLREKQIQQFQEDMKVQIMLASKGIMPTIYTCGLLQYNGRIVSLEGIEEYGIYRFAIMEQVGTYNLYNVLKKSIPIENTVETEVVENTEPNDQPTESTEVVQTVNTEPLAPELRSSAKSRHASGLRPPASLLMEVDQPTETTEVVQTVNTEPTEVVQTVNTEPTEVDQPTESTEVDQPTESTEVVMSKEEEQEKIRQTLSPPGSFVSNKSSTQHRHESGRQRSQAKVSKVPETTNLPSSSHISPLVSIPPTSSQELLFGKTIITRTLHMYQILAKEGICNVDVKPPNVVISFVDTSTTMPLALRQIDQILLIDIDTRFNIRTKSKLWNQIIMQLMFLHCVQRIIKHQEMEQYIKEQIHALYHKIHAQKELVSLYVFLLETPLVQKQFHYYQIKIPFETSILTFYPELGNVRKEYETRKLETMANTFRPTTLIPEHRISAKQRPPSSLFMKRPSRETPLENTFLHAKKPMLARQHSDIPT
jgi:hypothetical protein